MARSTCTPAEICCDPTGFARSNESFKAAVLTMLCNLAGTATPGVRYDYEVLCDPTTGDPVFVRWAYDTDGVLIGTSGFNPDGTPYAGSLNALVSCSAQPQTFTRDAVIDAELLSNVVVGVPQTYTFTVPVKSVAITDLGSGLLSVLITTSGGTGGNAIQYVPPGGSHQISLDRDTVEFITAVEITRVSGVNGDVIVNGVDSGRNLIV